MRSLRGRPTRSPNMLEDGKAWWYTLSVVVRGCISGVGTDHLGVRKDRSWRQVGGIGALLVNLTSQGLMLECERGS